MKQERMKCSLGRVRLNAWGYDNRGCYWGTGQPLYWMCSDCGESWHVRAPSREVAKARVRAQFPNKDVRFYR